MKSAWICVLFAAVIVFSTVVLSNGDIMDCSQGCDKDLCPPTGECKCSSYLDECKCCERCFKCPGEQCSIVARERCYGGVCQQKEGLNSFERMNQPGICTEREF